ncbi:MAG: hypothetical protein AB7S26_09670 [Sandaracinaceae bacterium]
MAPPGSENEFDSVETTVAETPGTEGDASHDRTISPDADPFGKTAMAAPSYDERLREMGLDADDELDDVPGAPTQIVASPFADEDELDEPAFAPTMQEPRAAVKLDAPPSSAPSLPLPDLSGTRRAEREWGVAPTVAMSATPAPGTPLPAPSAAPYVLPAASSPGAFPPTEVMHAQQAPYAPPPPRRQLSPLMLAVIGASVVFVVGGVLMALVVALLLLRS